MVDHSISSAYYRLWRGTSKNVKRDEEIISKDDYYSMSYARNIIKKRFLLGEKSFLNSDEPLLCLEYAQLIGKRFLFGENTIKLDSIMWKRYISFLEEINNKVRKSILII